MQYAIPLLEGPMLEILSVIALIFVCYLFFNKGNYANGMRLERNWCIANLYLDEYSKEEVLLQPEKINHIVAKVHSLDTVQLVDLGKKYKNIRGQHYRPVVSSAISVGLPQEYYV